jgi:hypothetical protein
MENSVKKINSPSTNQIVRHNGFQKDGNLNYPCDVLIIGGDYYVGGRISNFWSWQRVLSDGTIISEIETGYGDFSEIENKYKVKIEIVSKDNKLEDAWDFVEKYYPNYSSSENISDNEDLHKLTNKEFEIGDGAHYMLINYYDGNIDNPQILIDKTKSDSEIYERAIEEYILNLNK